LRFSLFLTASREAECSTLLASIVGKISLLGSGRPWSKGVRLTKTQKSCSKNGENNCHGDNKTDEPKETVEALFNDRQVHTLLLFRLRYLSAASIKATKNYSG
jgi:hypothetical protein